MFRSDYQYFIDDLSAQKPAQHLTIGDEAFIQLIYPRVSALLAFCQYVHRNKGSIQLNRPLVGFIQGEGMIIEELLDAYGARNSQQWHFFRTLIGGIKAFSAVAFELLHVLHTYKRYPDFPDRQNFAQESAEALEAVGLVLAELLELLMQEAAKIGLSLPHQSQFPASFYTENLPPGSLPRNRKDAHVATAAQRIVHLATEFLNLVARGDYLFKAAKVERMESLVPEVLNEEGLMLLEYRFHSLQSLYDTYVGDSTTEASDVALRTLRGHISTIYHLLEVGTQVVHFLERHQVSFNKGLLQAGVCPGRQHQHITHLLRYAISQIGKYLKSGRGLSHDMLRRYAEIASVEVPIPSYRGFHVRPSTLVAKIVSHYGSEVTMTLDGDKYDAGSPLDLFRANERINAMKRHKLGDSLNRIPGTDLKATADLDLTHLLRSTIVELAGQDIVFIYKRPLEVDPVQPDPAKTVGELFHREIIRLMGAGKLDISLKMTATFTGDKRVLNDLKMLTDNGYCEDAFGNNIPIPPELIYLKR